MTKAKPVMQRRLAAILCADIVAYSRLVSIDEAGTFRRVKALRADLLGPLVAKHGGRIVSYAGDGTLAEFPSVVRAVECALTIQSTATMRDSDVPADQRITLRIGIHSGDILADSTNDLCGDAINIAARLEQLAEPGGICLSNRAYEEMAGRVDAAFDYGGERSLKNIGYEVGVWFWPTGDRCGSAINQHSAARNRPNGSQGTHWPEMFENVPPRDLNFIGRDDALASLHRLLMQAERPAAITQAAIHGLGGIGKTTLAAEYAYLHAGDYAGVWWAPAETRTVLLASLVALAARLEPGLSDEADQEKAARAGLAHLARSAVPYLLVYDNVETPEVLRDLVPLAGARVVLTTRWADWSGRAEELELAVLGSKAAVAFLQKRAGRRDDPGAAHLAEALGYLPLALEHAGAYCRLTGLSFDAYRERIDRVIARTPKGATSPASVGATFSLAILKATAECPAAEELLGLCAYVAPERIPLDLIADADEGECAEALMTLTTVSLIEHVELGNGEPAVTLHRLVQAAMCAHLAQRGVTEAIIERVTRRLAEAFPERAYSKISVWPRCAVLLPHVLALRERLHPGSGPPELGRLYHAAGTYLHLRGAYVKAEQLYKEAIVISEKVLGRDDPTIAFFIGTLAHLYRETRRYAEAEPLLKEALAISENSLGHGHAEVAMCLGRLARLYTDTGRYAEAEPLFAEALAIGEKTLGRDDPTMAIFIGNLAVLYRETGRYAEAELLYKEAIAIGEKTLDRDHPDISIWVNNLALVYYDTGRYAEAETLFKEAIARYRKTLASESGADTVLGKLPRPYTETCDHTTAEPVGNEALVALERARGREHPMVASQLSNLARLYTDTGRYMEGEPLFQEAISIYQNTLGHSHPVTARGQRYFADLLLATGRSEEALQQAKDALAIHDEVLGANHPWTAASAQACATALTALGRSAEASALAVRFDLLLAGTKRA